MAQTIELPPGFKRLTINEYERGLYRFYAVVLYVLSTGGVGFFAFVLFALFTVNRIYPPQPSLVQTAMEGMVFYWLVLVFLASTHLNYVWPWARSRMLWGMGALM